MTLRVLDLFCGLGGASMGYSRAGFEVTGVDIKPQPDYPFDFYQTDVRYLSLSFVNQFDLIHASPPCQAYLKGSIQHGGHPKLYEYVRDNLDAIGAPYVIENPAARPDVVLCGLSFGLRVFRHRRFELRGWSAVAPAHRSHQGHRVRGWRHGRYHEGDMLAVYGNGGGKATVEECREGLGISWSCDRAQLVEAIPPAYTEYLAKQLLEAT